MRIHSIQVGMPREIVWQGKPLLTGIFKEAVKDPVHVGRLHLDGDGQADLSVHGGVDKAVYAYDWEAYALWREALRREELLPGALGENLTVSGLEQARLCLGDVIRIGVCELQVAQPRFPCFKFGILHGDSGVIRKFLEIGIPGVYFRVLREGYIQAGDDVRILSRDPAAFPLNELFAVSQAKSLTAEQWEKLQNVASLSPEWRQKLANRARYSLR